MSINDDRAVLDGKSRDELVAIAAAAGIAVPPRSRRETIIAAILEPGTNGAPPAEANATAAESAAAATEPASATNGATGEPVVRRRTATPPADGAGRATADGDGGKASTDGTPSDASGAADTGGSVEDANRRQRRRGAPTTAQGDNPSEVEPCDGLLDLRDEGYGFLRTKGLMPSPDDVYVGARQVRTYGLRRGDRIAGSSRPAARSEKNPALLKLNSINGADPESGIERPVFEDLAAVYPDLQIFGGTVLSESAATASWASDRTKWNSLLQSVFGEPGLCQGQRVLFAVPADGRPDSNRLMLELAAFMGHNKPALHVVLLTIDEQPENATRALTALSTTDDVVVSSADRPPDEHVTTAELTLERVKRMAETGADVVLLFDGLTRLARMHGRLTNGRQQGPVGEVGAIAAAKRYFATARNFEAEGSLTMLATLTVAAEGSETPFQRSMAQEMRSIANAEFSLEVLDEDSKSLTARRPLRLRRNAKSEDPEEGLMGSYVSTEADALQEDSGTKRWP